MALNALTNAYAQSSSSKEAREAQLALLLGVICLIAGVTIGNSAMAAAVFGAGLVFFCLGTAMRLLSRRTQRVLASQRELVSEVVAHDEAICALTDTEGTIVEMNEAARKRVARDLGGGKASATPRVEVLGEIIGLMMSNPGNLLHRMRSKVAEHGYARDSVVTRKGQLRISAQDIGADLLLWRVEEVSESELQRAPDGVTLPRVTVARTGAVLFMNDAARRLFGRRATSVEQLSEEPLRQGSVVSIDSGNGRHRCLVAQAEISGSRRELFFLPAPDEMMNAGNGTEFDELPVPLIKLDPEGKILRANSEALRLLEIDATADTRLGDLLEGLGRPVRDWIADVVTGRAQNSAEFLRVALGTKERYLQVSLKRVEEGAGPALIAVLSDATELKTLEAQFVQSQKMQAIGQLAGGVAHDFNNLLTAISGHCDLLLLRHDQGDPDYGDLVQINQNANRAAALVSQLLAFSRKQTLRPELIDLRDTLSDLSHLLNRLVGEKLQLSVEHDPVLRPVRVDKRQLEQVMMNLVVNARDAMPDGGEISITTEVLFLKTPLKRDRAVVAPGEYVAVKVGDKGCGIAPDKLQKVFEPFYTTKRAGEGTGLGLSTVYGIVKQTGGFIFVDSVLGQGTCFTLLFPVHDEVESPCPPMPDLQENALPAQSDAVVLLVEDEAPVRAFASRALRLRGFTVIEAQSAEEALERLEDPNLHIDVFVTDVVMPGMDGPCWVRKALKARPNARTVFVSGYAEENFGEDQARIPNSVFLPKPFSLNELTETVQRQIH